MCRPPVGPAGLRPGRQRGLSRVAAQPRTKLRLPGEVKQEDGEQSQIVRAQRGGDPGGALGTARGLRTHTQKPFAP